MTDLTKGKPSQVMLRFAIPIGLGNIFQLFYSLADTRVVGSTLGLEALAAVGATTSISTLFVGFLNGLAAGFAIPVAREYGAGKMAQVRRFAAGAIALGVLMSLGFTLLCVGFLPFILQALQVSEELMPQATAYIRVILLGLVMTLLYNAFASILRAVGDTVAALAFLICSSFLNVALDLLFICVFHMGVGGAALATVVSQVISAAASAIYMCSRYEVFRFRLSDFKIDKKLCDQLLPSGLSMAIMMSLVYFGTLALQTAINTFGNDTIVAHTAARKITEFFMLPFIVLGTTMATYCGQNMGAGKKDRIKEGIKQAILITFVWSVGMIVLSYTVAPQLVWLVTGSDKEAVVQTAAMYLKFDSLFYFAPAAICILRNALQGMGEHKVPVFSSAIELIGKVAVVLFLTPVFAYWGIIVAEPLVWLVMVIPLVIQMRKMMNQSYTSHERRV